MKKIGIVTFHRAINYGAVLQALALQKFLLSRKYQVEEIDYISKNEKEKYKIISFKRLSNIKRFCVDLLYLNKNFIKKRNFNKFLKDNFVLSNKKINLKNFKKLIQRYDVIITGSDQVWNYELLDGIDNVYFLNFNNKNVKKISYAASIGKSEINDKYIQDYRNILKTYNHISVREETAKKCLNKINVDNVDVVIDPVFLLTKNDWNNLLNSKKQTKEKYIVSYMLSHSDEYCEMVEMIAKKTGYKVIHFEKKNYYNSVCQNMYSSNPMEFVELIKNAEYVITTSFHATVFSIIFEKKFFVYPYNKTASRVTDLLKKFKLEKNIISDIEEFKKIDYDFETDWESVNKKLEEEREKSINWLENAINS